MPRLTIIFCTVFLLFCACRSRTAAPQASTPYFDSVIAACERLYDAGKKDTALRYVIAAAHNTKHPLNVEDKLNYQTYKSLIFYKAGDYDSYILCADSILQLAGQCSDARKASTRQIQAFNMHADALFAKGLYNESYGYYYKAKQLASATADSCSLSRYSYTLGMALYRQERFHEAARQFTGAYSESEKCREEFSSFYYRQELLDNKGLCYSKCGMRDSALYYYTAALSYIAANKDKYTHKDKNVYASASAVVYGNIADLYIAQGKYTEAEELLNKSIQVNLQQGYANEDAETDQEKLAELYYSTKETGKLKTVLDEIHSEMDTIPNKQVELQWNRLMGRYYDNIKDSAAAYRYLTVYMAQRDSMAAKRKMLLASDISGRVQTLERDYQITLLEKDKLKQQIYLAIVSLAIIFAITIIALVQRNATRAHRNVEALTGLNNTVNRQKELLQTALDALEEKDKDKSRILHSVAHDVMNPIAAISSLADILLAEADAYTEEHKDILKMIQEASANSLALSRDIIEAAASITPGTLARERVNINQLVSSSAGLLRVRAAEKNQVISIGAGQPDLCAHVDKDKIWRVLNNLITNAIKFSYEGAEIKIGIAGSGAKVIISVADSGVGIPEKSKPHIFDMFTEGKRPGTAGERPHGLGLSICQQIVRAHGGKIWFESTEGKGTAFFVELPANGDV